MRTLLLTLFSLTLTAPAYARGSTCHPPNCPAHRACPMYIICDLVEM